MAHRKIHTALKALELQQNIQEDDSDAESDAKADASVYHLDEDNRDDSESESSPGESLVLESSNSEIRILKIPKRFQKRLKITINRIMQQALQLQLKLLGIF